MPVPVLTFEAEAEWTPTHVQRRAMYRAVNKFHFGAEQVPEVKDGGPVTLPEDHKDAAFNVARARPVCRVLVAVFSTGMVELTPLPPAEPISRVESAEQARL